MNQMIRRGGNGSHKSDCIRRYQALFQQMGQRSIILGNVLWTAYQKMVVPVGPVSDEYVIALDKHKIDLLEYFKKCVLIRASGGFVAEPGTWYCVLCNHSVDLALLSENSRSKVRRGLKNCSVCRIDVEFMKKHAWPVLASAFNRYRNTRLNITEKRFKRDIQSTDGFGDIIHYWGVFEKATGQLIAYAQNYLYNKTEVNYSALKFHPDFLRHYPSYALFYEMNRYYLREQNFAYVNDGFRSLLHETNIQDFLITKFFFKKQPVKLKIHYRPFLGWCMSGTYSFRHLLGKLNPALAALYKLEEINRSSPIEKDN